MKTENPLKIYNIGFKIYLILNVYNIFSKQIPSIVFPYLLQYEKEFSNTEDSIFITKDELNTKAYWINENSYYQREETGEYYLIKSHDDSTKLYLMGNLRIIKIEYLQIVQGDDSQFNYYKAVKFFSINNMPPIWNVPLKLLIAHFNLDIDSSKIYIDYMSSIITYKEYSSKLPELSNEEFSLSKYPDDEVNPIAFIFNRELSLKFLYTENFTYLINENEENLDIIYNEFPHLLNFTTNYMSILNYQLKEEADNIKSVEIESYSKLLNQNNNEDINNFIKDCFLHELVLEIYDIKKYYKKYEVISSILREKKKSYLDNFINELKNDFIFDGNEVYIFNAMPNVGEFYAYLNRAIKIQFFDRTILKIDSKHKKIYILDKVGDKHIQDIEKLDNKFGPYLTYYDYALQFYNYCFMTSKEKKEVEDNLKFIKELSNASLNRIELLTDNKNCGGIYNKNNQVVNVEGENKFSKNIELDNNNHYDEFNFDVNKILEKNAQFLQDCKKLLK